MHFTILVTTAVLASVVHAFPRITPEEIKRAIERSVDIEKRAVCNDKQTARLFVLPAQATDTSSKKIPDAAHPYVAPGPGDTRGPCPMLNTLANHGYISHTGVDTTENIIKAVMEGGNMDAQFAGFLASFGTLSRGNANTATLSIGYQTGAVPPLPGCIDGPVALGLAGHGRFEGDVSISRLDAGLGDPAPFSESTYDQFLQYVATYGDAGPDGAHTVVNVKTFQEFKYAQFLGDQAADKSLQYHVGRQVAAYSEIGIALSCMQDGRTGLATVKQVSSFFQNQTFGDDFFRRQGPAGVTDFSTIATAVRNAHPISPGANDANGNYVIDTPASTNFFCDGYLELATTSLAAALNKTTGVLAQNVQTMTAAMFAPFHAAGCTTMGFPSGPAGV